MIVRRTVLLGFAVTACARADSTTPAQALMAFDERIGADGTLFAKSLHAAFRAHTGLDRILDRAQFPPRAAVIAHVAEAGRVVGSVGVVMGLERGPAQGVEHRFTHVYVQEAGQWYLAARHDALIVARSTAYAVEPPDKTNKASAAPAFVATTADERALLEANADATRTVLAADAATMRARLHPDYLVTTPEFKVYDRDGVADLFASGRIASDRFERTVESLTIIGDLGMVMGRELVVPKADTRSAPVLTHRRYSSFYVRENARWRQLARHAHVVRRTA